MGPMPLASSPPVAGRSEPGAWATEPGKAKAAARAPAGAAAASYTPSDPSALPVQVAGIVDAAGHKLCRWRSQRVE